MVVLVSESKALYLYQTVKRRQDESRKERPVRAEEEHIEVVYNEEKIVPLCIDNKPQMVARARDEGGETSR